LLPTGSVRLDSDAVGRLFNLELKTPYSCLPDPADLAGRVDRQTCF
jgi:hypothetical protein